MKMVKDIFGFSQPEGWEMKLVKETAFEEGFEEGLREAREMLAKIEMARKLKEMDVSLETIAKATELSIEKIETL